MQWTAKVQTALAVLSCSGCSFVFMTGPPDKADIPPPPAPVKCTSSGVAPFIDTIVAGFQAVRTGLAAVADDSDYEGASISREVDIALGVTLAGVFVVSAMYGYDMASRCVKAKKRQRRRPVPGSPQAAATTQVPHRNPP